MSGPLDDEKVFGGLRPPNSNFPTEGVKILNLGIPCYEFSRIEILNQPSNGPDLGTSTFQISEFYPKRWLKKIENFKFSKNAVLAGAQHCSSKSVKRTILYCTKPLYSQFRRPGGRFHHHLLFTKNI